MDPVDEYARLKSEVRRLQDRLEALRQGFLRPGARLRSNQYEVQVRRQKRRVFVKDRLPSEVLTDPRYWEERESEVVTFRPLGPGIGDPFGAYGAERV
jgi:hypothetical protein